MSKRKEEHIIKIKNLEKRVVALNGTLETMIIEGGTPLLDINDTDVYTIGYHAGLQAAQRALWSYFKEVLESVHGENYGTYIRW